MPESESQAAARCCAKCLGCARARFTFHTGVGLSTLRSSQTQCPGPLATAIAASTMQAISGWRPGTAGPGATSSPALSTMLARTKVARTRSTGKAKATPATVGYGRGHGMPLLNARLPAHCC